METNLCVFGCHYDYTVYTVHVLRGKYCSFVTDPTALLWEEIHVHPVSPWWCMQKNVLFSVHVYLCMKFNYFK